MNNILLVHYTWNCLRILAHYKIKTLKFYHSNTKIPLNLIKILKPNPVRVSQYKFLSLSLAQFSLSLS